MIAVWKQAEKTGEPPSAAAFCSLARQIDGRGWEVEPASGTARRVSQGAVTVDALAKGYIVDKAVAAASGRIDGVRGMMLDIGGDIAVWGTASAAKDDAPWQVGVADPRHPQDNAPSLAVLSLRNRAVATSGNYARYFEVASKRYSHILDARTGWSADDVISATVVAADCMTADALATVLSVLPPAKGLELIGSLREERAEVECLIIDRSGKAWPSVGWQAALVPQPVLLQAAGEGAWEHELGISFSIANPGGRKYRRPFVAIWIEDADGKPVRTLAVWGKEAKYLKDLRSWWAFARNDRKLVQAVTRASRAPGRYQLVWDGNNDKGQPLPQGTYTVRVESAREKGQHVNMNGRIACMDKAATARIEGNSEIGEVSLSYGVREKKP
jgi:thiamine biosynthesis lipoprotein